MKSLTDISFNTRDKDKKGKTGIQGSVFRFRDQDMELLTRLCTFVIKLVSDSGKILTKSVKMTEWCHVMCHYFLKDFFKKIHAIYEKKLQSVYFQSGADSGNYKEN